MTTPTDTDRDDVFDEADMRRVESQAYKEGIAEGQRRGIELAAKVAMHHANARRAAQDDAKKRKAKVEARDFESMAIEATQIECAIRNLAPEAEQ